MAGIMMTVFGAGTLIGGPLAGWLSDHHGWQWSFWVQVSRIPPMHTSTISSWRWYRSRATRQREKKQKYGEE